MIWALATLAAFWFVLAALACYRCVWLQSELDELRTTHDILRRYSMDVDAQYGAQIQQSKRMARGWVTYAVDEQGTPMPNRRDR